MPAKRGQSADRTLAVDALAGRIQLIRGHRVMLDADLAAL